MKQKTKKAYKVFHKPSGKYITVGYNRKASWFVFPSAAMQNDSDITLKPDDYEVHQFETIVVNKLNINGEVI